MWAVNYKLLSNYQAGVLRFTQFCDIFNIPEDLQMPAPEWLLLIFITTQGAGSVGSGVMKSWLLGIKFWHIINDAPWHGAHLLKRATQDTRSATPPASMWPKRALVTLAHLVTL